MSLSRKLLSQLIIFFDENPIRTFSNISINDIGLNKYLGYKSACTKTPNHAMEPEVSTKVVYMCSSLLQLALGSCDSSQVEKKITVNLKLSKLEKMTLKTVLDYQSCHFE